MLFYFIGFLVFLLCQYWLLIKFFHTATSSQGFALDQMKDLTLHLMKELSEANMHLLSFKLRMDDDEEIDASPDPDEAPQGAVAAHSGAPIDFPGQVFSFSPYMLAIVDQARGSKPRGEFLEAAIRRHIQNPEDRTFVFSETILSLVDGARGEMPRWQWMANVIETKLQGGVS